MIVPLNSKRKERRLMDKTRYQFAFNREPQTGVMLNNETEDLEFIVNDEVIYKVKCGGMLDE